MMNMGAAAAGELAAVDALATGAPWRDLAKLANASGQTGLYRFSLPLDLQWSLSGVNFN